MDWYQVVREGIGPTVALLGLAWLIHRKYLYLGREFEREVKRADEAEARADKYEDLILKGRHIMSNAASSHEEIVEELSELARRHGGLTS